MRVAWGHRITFGYPQEAFVINGATRKPYPIWTSLLINFNGTKIYVISNNKDRIICNICSCQHSCRWEGLVKELHNILILHI